MGGMWVRESPGGAPGTGRSVPSHFFTKNFLQSIPDHLIQLPAS